MKNSDRPKVLYINLPEPIHRVAKAVAALEGRQLGDVVVDAISAYVADRFPQLVVPSGSDGEPKSPNKPKSPKPPKQPPATTGPGSPGYVAPKSVVEDEECLSEPLPLATADENPFEGDDVGDDLLPGEGG